MVDRSRTIMPKAIAGQSSADLDDSVGGGYPGG